MRARPAESARNGSSDLIACWDPLLDLQWMRQRGCTLDATWTARIASSLMISSQWAWSVETTLLTVDLMSDALTATFFSWLCFCHTAQTSFVGILTSLRKSFIPTSTLPLPPS